MEPRARAGKNVGKMNFSVSELSMLLYAHGDHKRPLPETCRVLDEIVCDFLQGLTFEAAAVAHHAGRVKIKYPDLEFALRRNPHYLGKIQETFEKKKNITEARKAINDLDDPDILNAAGDAIIAEVAAGGGGTRGRGRKPRAKRAAAAAAATTAPVGGSALSFDGTGDDDGDVDTIAVSRDADQPASNPQVNHARKRVSEDALGDDLLGPEDDDPEVEWMARNDRGSVVGSKRVRVA